MMIRTYLCMHMMFHYGTLNSVNKAESYMNALRTFHFHSLDYVGKLYTSSSKIWHFGIQHSYIGLTKFKKGFFMLFLYTVEITNGKGCCRTTKNILLKISQFFSQQVHVCCEQASFEYRRVVTHVLIAWLSDVWCDHVIMFASLCTQYSLIA